MSLAMSDCYSARLFTWWPHVITHGPVQTCSFGTPLSQSQPGPLWTWWSLFTWDHFYVTSFIKILLEIVDWAVTCKYRNKTKIKLTIFYWSTFLRGWIIQLIKSTIMYFTQQDNCLTLSNSVDCGEFS